MLLIYCAQVLRHAHTSIFEIIVVTISDLSFIHLFLTWITQGCGAPEGCRLGVKVKFPLDAREHLFIQSELHLNAES
jgi:hypothetical protein